MRIGNLTIDGQLFLAPLAGISNRPFRLLARKYGAAMCYTEMVSADAIIRRQEKTIRMVDIVPGEHPVGVQLFGSVPEYMAGSVKMINKFKPDLIDLNLGCPVKKVIKKNGGAALLNDLPRANELMLAAVENSTVPVTIKIRSGWETGKDVYLEIGKLAEKAGISAITLHPRSRTQNYSIKADWSKISLLKKEVSIPIIGNGDIENGNDAGKMLKETGCDAIMIARAVMKNPYVFAQIKSFLDGGEILPNLTIKEKIDLALEHSRLQKEYYGDENGAKMMRKHLLWYTKGFKAGGPLRKKLMTACSFEDISQIFSDYLKNINTAED